jgi:hypothetical protein
MMLVITDTESTSLKKFINYKNGFESVVLSGFDSDISVEVTTGLDLVSLELRDRDNKSIYKKILKPSELTKEDDDLLESVEVEIPEDLFLKLALEAHNQDITFNDHVNNIFREFLFKGNFSEIHDHTIDFNDG